MAKEPRRGFPDLPCPNCGTNGHVNVELDDLRKFWCDDCEQCFTAAEVRHFIDRWEDVLAWLITAPEIEE